MLAQMDFQEDCFPLPVRLFYLGLKTSSSTGEPPPTGQSHLLLLLFIRSACGFEHAALGDASQTAAMHQWTRWEALHHSVTTGNQVVLFSELSSVTWLDITWT